MLQRLREHAQGWIAWIIIILIAATFILMGRGSVNTSNTPVAKVNGSPITQTQFEQAYERQLRQMDPATLAQSDSQLIKEQALKRLIDAQILNNAARQYGLVVSDAQLVQQIQAIPEFQVKQHFSISQYNQLLAANHYSDREFRAELRNDILLNQLRQGIIDSAFYLPNDLAQLAKFIDQRRDLNYVLVPQAQFKSDLQLTEEQLLAYYASHDFEFMSEAQLKVDYVLLSLENLKADLEINPTELEHFYTQNVHFYTQPKKIKVAHILLENPKNDADPAQVKANIDALYTQLQQGAEFETLAAQSQDLLSASKGGELGWIGHGEMVPEFEREAFALEKDNAFTAPFQTSYGWHIVKRLAYQPEKVPSLAEIKTKLSDQYRSQMAEAQLLNQADELNRLLYEFPETLNVAAEQLALKVNRSAWFSAQGSEDPILDQAVVLASAFSEEVLELGNNSELLQLDNGDYLGLRVAQHRPATQYSFAEVAPQIEQLLSDQYAQDLAQDVAQSIQHSLLAKASIDEMLDAHQLKWAIHSNIARNETQIPTLVVQRAFALPRPDYTPHPVVDVITMANGDAAVLQVTQVNDGEVDKLDPELMAFLTSNLAHNMGQMDYQFLVSEWMQQAKIQRNL
jgi:peptidyl-prolyl cis-trans isomerase D